MKKYLPVTVTFFISIFVIGYMYISHVIANQEAIYLKTVRGDDLEVKKIVLDFSIWNDDLYKPARLEDGRVQMMNHFSLWYFLTGAERSPEINNLIQKERHFMRGKSLGNENFFENEEYLAYVNVHYTHRLEVENKGRPDEYEYYHYFPELVVDVLEKETKKQWAFTLDVPDDEAISFLRVEDVQMIGGELKVLARLNPLEDTEYYQIYTIDFTLEKITDSTKIDTPDVQEIVFLVNNPMNLKPENYYVFSAYTMEEEGSSAQTEHYYLFNLETEDLTELHLDFESFGQPVTLQNDTVYFVNQENGLEVIAYDIKTENTESIVFLDVKANDGFATVCYEDSKYFVTSWEDENTIQIFVVDGQSGELLYEGQIYHEDEQVEMYVDAFTVL